MGCMQWDAKNSSSYQVLLYTPINDAKVNFLIFLDSFSRELTRNAVTIGGRHEYRASVA
jgi:hypothetical protein